MLCDKCLRSFSKRLADTSLFNFTPACRRSFYVFDGIWTVNTFHQKTMFDPVFVLSDVFQLFTGNESLANVSIQQHLHLEASKCFQMEISFSYAANGQSWNTCLALDFSGILACAMTIFLSTYQVPKSSNVCCVLADRSRSLPFFDRCFRSRRYAY